MAELIKTGKTVDIAVEQALKELNLQREQVTVEVIELEVKKFFGSKPAKVKIIYDEQPQKTITEKPVQQTTEKTAPTKNVEISEKTQIAAEFLTTVAKLMGVDDVKVNPSKKGENVVLVVEGENAGTLIGRRGETMDALNYLTGLVANRMGGTYEKIGLDVAGYRGKREKDLEVLATRMAEKVAKYGKNHVFEPMNPYERRIIHSAISNVQGVQSESTGEGATRRVVIICTNENKQSGYTSSSYNPNRAKTGYSRERSDFKRGGYSKSRAKSSNYSNDRKRFDKPKAEPIKSTRVETINDAVDIGLYGKIDI